LDIFDFHRSSALSPQWKWLRLAHVCRKWRHLVSISPRRLDLRILCESGSAIESVLGFWPTLPLIIQYKKEKSESLPKNIVVALRRTDRICEIDLVLSSSLIGSIVEVIREPFQALERIRVTFKDATGPAMPIREAFLGGSAPHLREIKLVGVAFPFPAIRQVLLSTNNLVELHLPTNIPNGVYFSPDDLVTGLSTLVQLKRLTVGFYSPASSPPPRMICRPPQRTTLPSLTSLDFHGASEYLEEFATRIDLPVLREVNVRLFNDIIFEIPQFCQVVLRLNTLRPPSVVFVKLSEGSVSVTVHQTGDSPSGKCLLETSCRRLDGQLSFVAQILSQLSPLLSSVRVVLFSSDRGFPAGEEDVDSTQWLDVFQPFTHATRVSVWEERFVPGILKALVTEDVAAGVLPKLTSARLRGCRSSPFAAKATEQFIATRGLSGRTIFLSG
jgi:hypothetical protein